MLLGYFWYIFLKFTHQIVGVVSVAHTAQCCSWIVIYIKMKAIWKVIKKDTKVKRQPTNYMPVAVHPDVFKINNIMYLEDTNTKWLSVRIPPENINDNDITRLYSKNIAAQDNKELAKLILSETYDCIPNEKLLGKLNFYGVNGICMENNI